MSDRDIEGRPGLDSSDLPEGGHSIVATLADMDSARLLVEDLEAHGVPPGSISLKTAVAPEDDRANEQMPESDAFTDITRSVLAGGAAGAVVGGVIGWLLALAMPGLEVIWGILFGAIFGSAIGGSAGGMAVAKHNSPAWRETYEAVEGGPVSVGVRDGDAEVLKAAGEIIDQHEPIHVDRST